MKKTVLLVVFALICNTGLAQKNKSVLGGVIGKPQTTNQGITSATSSSVKSKESQQASMPAITFPLPLKKGNSFYYIISCEHFANQVKKSDEVEAWNFRVTNETTDGYSIEAELLGYGVTHSEGGLMQELLSIQHKTRVHNILKFKANKNGEIVDLQNADAVRNEGNRIATKAILEIIDKYPQLRNDTKLQSALDKQISEYLSKEELLNWANSDYNPLGLSTIVYNRTIKDGMKEEYISGEGLKLTKQFKSEFNKNGQVEISTRSRITSAEIKSQAIEQLISKHPEDKKYIQENIDVILKNSGLNYQLLDFYTLYTFRGNSDQGWPYSIEKIKKVDNSTTKIFSTIVSKDELKEYGVNL